MRRFVFTLPLLLMLMLTGCKTEQSADSSDAAVSAKTVYSSDTSAEDCYLCGGGIDSPLSPYWGQDNIALISLNTFEIKLLEINRYDRTDGRLIEEYSGAVSLIVGNNDGSFSASLIQDSDKGYATGHVDFYSDELLDVSKAAGFLCENCLNEILPSRIDRCFGVGAINLATKEVRIFEEHLGGFGLGDFYIDCDLQDRDDDKYRMNLLIFLCPAAVLSGIWRNLISCSSCAATISTNGVEKRGTVWNPLKGKNKGKPERAPGTPADKS